MGVEMVDRAVPGGALGERAGVAEHNEPAAGASQREGQFPCVLAECHGPMRVTARQAQKDDVAFALMQAARQGDLERETPTAQDFRLLDKPTQQLNLSFVQSKDGNGTICGGRLRLPG